MNYNQILFPILILSFSGPGSSTKGADASEIADPIKVLSATDAASET